MSKLKYALQGYLKGRGRKKWDCEITTKPEATSTVRERPQLQGNPSSAWAWPYDGRRTGSNHAPRRLPGCHEGPFHLPCQCLCRVEGGKVTSRHKWVQRQRQIKMQDKRQSRNELHPFPISTFSKFSVVKLKFQQHFSLLTRPQDQQMRFLN